jgi:23S rRNA (guanosine2251-2'-O)-methyltransferase
VAAVQRIEGARPVIEAIRAGRRKILEIAAPEPRSSAARELLALARERGIPVRAAMREGIVARAEPFPEEPFEALLVSDRPRFLVALDRITDVGNLGSIARSAEAAGATGLVLEQRRSPPIEAGALRASSGALEYLRVGRAPSLPRALALAASEGLKILAGDPDGVPIQRIPAELMRMELVWVFGSEDRGLRQGVRERAEVLVAAPSSGRIGSLGVAAAAAFLLLRTAEIRQGH